MKNHDVFFSVKGSSVIGFVPASLAIEPGDTVTFTNGDTAGHSVIPDSGLFGIYAEIPLAGIGRKRLINPTDSVLSNRSEPILFEKAGTFGYHDQFGHKGIIEVKAPAMAGGK